MGRPPKKRARLEDDVCPMDMSDSGAWNDLDGNPLDSVNSRADAASSTEAFWLCPPVYRAQISKSSRVPQNTWNGVPQIGVPQQEESTMLEPVIPSDTPWPDYSNAVGIAGKLSESGIDSNCSLPQGTPGCTCLSYLYLTLSNLSTLTSFPITVQTIQSLYTASRTAREVIRCEVCPRQFSTGMQNVMFLGTLLNVLADSWLRVSKADPVDLGKQSVPAGYATSMSRDPENEAMKWKNWLSQTVRHAVIGGPIDPSASIKGRDTPDLLSLIKEMEARQRRWHAEGISKAETWRLQYQESPMSQSDTSSGGQHCAHSDRMDSSPEERNNADERDFLCLRVVASAREVISQFGFQAHEYPDGIIS